MPDQPATAREPVIVVGVDGSPASENALRWAAAHARLTGGELRVVGAWNLPRGYGYAPDYSGADFEAPARQEVEAAVDHVLGAQPDIPVDVQVLQGHPAAVLIEASKDADLLVVGSRGRGAFTGMLLGSVSQHCAQHAACPTLIVRDS